MTVTIGGVDLGQVIMIQEGNSEVIDKRSPPSYAGSASVLTSISGVTKELTIQGILTGTSIATLKTAVDNLRAKISGNQTSPVSLVIDIAGTNFITINVMIREFTWTYNTDVFAVVNYTLKVVEGTS